MIRRRHGERDGALSGCDCNLFSGLKADFDVLGNRHDILALEALGWVS